MNVLFGQKRKIEVEKICYLEIQLTALIWNESSFSRWLCCRQAGRQSQHSNTGSRDTGRRPGDFSEELPEWYELGVQEDSDGAHLWGLNPNVLPHLHHDSGQSDGSGREPSWGQEKDQKREARDCICLVSLAPPSVSDTWKVPKKHQLEKKSNPCSEG